jgi:hypothetical protein
MKTIALSVTVRGRDFSGTVKKTSRGWKLDNDSFSDDDNCCDSNLIKKGKAALIEAAEEQDSMSDPDWNPDYDDEESFEDDGYCDGIWNSDC